MSFDRYKKQVSRIGAYGLVLQDHKILLCRLSKRVPHIAGRWTLPGGGIEFGEDPVDAVSREVLEETGMDVRAQTLAGVQSYASENRERKFHSIRIVYHTQLLGGDLRHEADGSTDLCAWYSHAEALQLPLVNLGELGLQLAFEKRVN